MSIPSLSESFFFYDIPDFCYGNAEEKKIVNLLKKSTTFPELNDITVFDVGCYKGKFSKNINSALVKFFKKPIYYYLFDPNINAKPLLSENIDFDYNYFQLAIDNTCTVKDFHLNTNSPWAGSSLQKILSQDKLWKLSRALIMGKTNKPFQTYQTKTQTIDNFCKDNNVSKIDILKIDVEGNEINVIQGAMDTLSSCSIIYVEVLDKNIFFHEKLEQLKTILIKKNFILHNVKSIRGVSLLSSAKGADTTFVRKDLLK